MITKKSSERSPIHRVKGKTEIEATVDEIFPLVQGVEDCSNWDPVK